MISILIPTMNRSAFLIRTLHYYSKIGFKGVIYIGDSSDDEHVEKNNRLIDSLKDKLKIVYRYFPNPPYLHDGMCMKELIEMVRTPYAVYSGDDDFLIPNGLRQCVKFLDNHPDYSAAHGFRANITLENERAFGKIISSYIVPGQISKSEIASERWIGYMKSGLSSQYYVHRTETWRRMYRDVDSVPSRYIGPELLPCSLTFILGKVKLLDCLSIVFQKQKDENKIFNWDTQSLFSLINHPNWYPSIKVTRDSIVESLVQKDGIDSDKANEIFERELSAHLIGILIHQYNLRYGPPNIPQEPPNVLFSTLLNPSCLFYPDFRKVYLAITAPVTIEQE